MADVKINLVSADGSFSKVLDKKWIKNIETKSQKSPSPEEIFYGSIENSGTLEVLDVDGSIKKAIDEGTLKNSGVEISVFVNGKQIGKHISKDTDYNSTLNVFRFELGDVLSDLDKLIYTGYDYKTDKSNTTLYDVLFDVFKKFFSIKNKRFDYSQLNLMLGNKNVSGMFLYDYLKGIVVQNAILEKGQSYRSAINKICEIAQLTLATDSKGEVMFFDSRPILPLDKIGKDIVIDKKHLIGVPDKSVFVNNNYNKVVVSSKKIILSKNAVLDSEIINPKGKELLDYYITEEGFEGEENYGTVNNPTDFYNAQSFYVGGYNPLNVWSMVAGKIEQYVSSGSFNIQKTSQMVELSKNASKYNILSQLEGKYFRSLLEQIKSASTL